MDRLVDLVESLGCFVRPSPGVESSCHLEGHEPLPSFLKHEDNEFSGTSAVSKGRMEEMAQMA